MGVLIYTRAAKCKDCKFCKSFYDGKKKKYTCANSKSEIHTEIITLNDLVCNKWELY
jgi:glutaredoxin